jgi:SagB-type dehydrogenase family enzyme
LNCEAVAPGLYHYALEDHELEELWVQDLREPLSEVTNDSRVVSASAVVVFSLVYGRICEKYGKRGLRYALLELGHMAQNISLTAAALHKGCYEIGGFVDNTVNKWLDVDGESESAALLVALGGQEFK